MRLLVQLVKPEAGNEINDPTVGSGGFLIQSHQYVEEQGQDPNDIALYGQGSNGTVWSICNMNMILHNITRFTVTSIFSSACTTAHGRGTTKTSGCVTF